MKRYPVLIAALACAHVLFSSGAAGQPVSAQRSAASAAPLVECPTGLLDASTFAPHREQSASLLEVDGALLNVSLLHVPGTDSLCAVMTSPQQRALSVGEYEALMDLALADVRQAAATPAQKVDNCTSLGAVVAAVYPGRCGTSTTPIASAYFATSHLALTAGAMIPAKLTDVCVVSGYGYHDVHEIRRSTDAGNAQLVGLSLVRPGPVVTGVRALSGPLINGAGAAYKLQIDGMLVGSAQPACQLGQTQWYNDWYASFIGSHSDFGNPAVINPGGPGWESAALSVPPLGLHVDNIRVTQGGSSGASINPTIRRFRAPDLAAVTTWANSAAPPAGRIIKITNPTANQLIDNANGTYVTVEGASYVLELDGQPFSNPIPAGYAEGWHQLVAYDPSAPQFRHTVAFELRRLSLPPDSYEPDNTQTTYKPLYEGIPQNHTFHNFTDVDWTAFAVGPRTKSTVTLTGVVARDASLRLFRQYNYPTGPITEVAVQRNKPNKLVVSNTGSMTGQTVYYVEARSSWTGPGTNYVLSVAVELLEDAFEPDDTQAAYTALYEGVPQTHNFHTVNDQDWVAFAVGPGVTSRVDLQGTAAAASQLEMYRHVNYPNGAVELVDSAAATPGALSVQHTGDLSESLYVYYVRARPQAGNTAAIRSNFALSVTVLP